MELNGKHVTVIGMGKTALALVKLLLQHGAIPFVSESAAEDQIPEPIAALISLGVAFECGGHTDVALAQAQLVVPSPGVPYDIPLIAQANERGIPVCSELELASPFLQGTIIAVTGTNGKTTTTELIAHLLRTAEESVALAGNNARPCSELAALDEHPDYVVLEVSSYQLEGIQEFRPDISVVLNVSNDHLGRHKSMEQYAACKARLMMNQTGADTAVLNFDDEIVRAMGEVTHAPIVSFGIDPGCAVTIVQDDIRLNGEHIARRSDSPLPGKHNTLNVLAAVGVATALELDSRTIQHGLQHFSGVEHRIERVDVLNGVTYYNDSKATNLDSLRVALESFEVPIVLIAGGEGKGSDYGEIIDVIAGHVKSAVVIGTDAALIESSWSTTVPVIRAASMDSAVQLASQQAASGDVVLLSPACASFDMYANFEERGSDFKRSVRALVNHEVDA